MKVQFIIVGWYYEKFPEFIDQLIYLNRNFDRINIFWSCHKEPPNRIKDNFNYKLFPNIGLEDGAYQQAIDYLNLSDDTILFLMHDDMAIKSFQFIEVCIDLLNKYKVIGNGLNYCDYINLDGSNDYIEVGNVTLANLGLMPRAGGTFTGKIIHNYNSSLKQFENNSKYNI